MSEEEKVETNSKLEEITSKPSQDNKRQKPDDELKCNPESHIKANTQGDNKKKNKKETEKKEAETDATEQPSETNGSGLVKIHWPWIPLTDDEGRTYFYNALTSKTSWSIEEDQTHVAPPPTAYAAACSQETWQEYWRQFQALQQAGNSNTQQLQQSESGKTVTATKASNKTNNDSVVGSGLAVYIEHYQTPTIKQLGRPARQQVRPPDNDSLGYTQGYEEYNIWYGKHLTDRFENPGPFGRREEREKATTRCNPFTDSGWTRADLNPPSDRPVICIFYAKGCCYLGSNCYYYHRLPTAEDDEQLDMLHDIFGRERFATHSDDMDGVGTFSEDCRTLFVGDLKINRVYANAEEKTEELIRQQFGLWGPVDDIKVIRNKNIAFVRYKYRVHAEFAKVAMAEQRLMLDRDDDQICVKWSHPGRGNEDKPDEQQQREWEMARKAMMKRLSSLGYTQSDVECMLRWEIDKQKGKETATSKYPNTNKVPVPLEEQPQANDDYEDLADPNSQATNDFNKMQQALLRIEQNSISYAVDI